MNSKSSGGRLEAFFTGKGFYIVLLLCAAIIGGSAWMMAAGERTMAEDISRMNRESLENHRVETVLLPPEEEAQPAMADTQVTRAEDEIAEPPETGEVWRAGDMIEAAAPVYVWPVEGQIERYHDSKVLSYDTTMRDWRTHEGVDILAPLGETVSAAHEGRVESIAQDDLYGTVVTVSHGDGTRTVYANLAEVPAVNVGDWVEPGDVIGAIGTTALGEIGQGTHLHFAVTVDGVNVNPLDYLPA